ncbi:MAG: hypothetical protein P1U30_03355, partial [Phycisphaerales bacterium]|nr:hypothetical protein [Phycisphaerales bacterium]
AILISHDRALIDAVCDHLIILDGKGNTEVFAGTYSEWQILIQAQTKPQQTTQKQPKPSPTKEPTIETRIESPKQQPTIKKSKFSWMPINQIEERMTDLEIKLKNLDAQLNDADIWKDIEHANKVTTDRDECRAELDELEEEWIRKS